MFNRLLDVLRGIVIGVSNIIPGVSGGTMAVSMGIYDRIIYAVNNIRKQFKKSAWELLPILIGVLIGLVAFARLIKSLLGTESDTIPMTCLPTNFAFIGLILGGLPAIYKRVNLKKAGFAGILLFLVFLALVVVLPVLTQPESQVFEPSFGLALLLIPLGALAGATMVIPGVSGSMVLMLLGYYPTVIGATSDLFEKLFSGDFSPLAILLPYVIGLLLGIAFIAKLMNFLLKKHAVLTFCAIFGLVIGSPVALLYQNRACFEITTAGNWVACGACLVIGFIAAWLMSRLDKEEAL